MRERIAKWLYPRIFTRAASYKAAYDAAWEDHLKRCGCHDSWDQCPHVEEGHAAYQVSWRGIPCSCCRWCSPNRTGAVSPFVDNVPSDA